MVEHVHSRSCDAHARVLDRGRQTKGLKLALAITLVFMAAEFAGGLWTNSLALLADSGHMLTDAGALGLSLFAVWFSRKPATAQKTYGYFRVEILAALANGVALLLIAAGILYEAYDRFFTPQPIRGGEMLLIAAAGLVANLACAKILHGQHDDNLNVRGAFLHVLGDVLGSLAAIVAGASILLWGAYWTDPAVSALVSLLICFSAWKVVSESIRILLEGAPSHISVREMRRALSKVPGVESVHDLHVWTLTSGHYAMTCHAVVESDGAPDLCGIMKRMSDVSKQQFQVHHTTIQIEDKHMCRDREGVCH